MRGGAVVAVLIFLSTFPASAAYLSAVVANQSSGVATFNTTISSGNTSWTLTHVESGAVPASQAPTDFTGATGLTAAWGTNLGNLTGNFTFQVWLNVSLGTVNNSTVWAQETKSAGFQISGPAPSPGPTPTATPPPPPPSSGDITLFLSSPEFGVSYSDILPVTAYVKASNGTAVSEVRMAIENAPPRPAVSGGTACDALPTGWRIAATSGNDSTLYRQQWDVNSSTLPLAPGDYTVYVRAQNNASKEACAVVPNVPVKVSVAATPAPSPNSTAPVAANATVITVACGGKPCAQGILGPMVIHKDFTVTLSAPAAVAFCGPTRCEREGAAENPGFTPTTDGRYCVRRIEPVHDSIAETLRFQDGGAEACWMTGGALYGSTNKPAGMDPATVWPIKDPKTIPCKPEVGRLEPYSYYDSAARAQVSGERTIWELTADPNNPTYLVCDFSQPVYWEVDTPLCPAANRSMFLGGGNYESRAQKDGAYLPWAKTDVARRTQDIPILCQGVYTIRTLGQDGDPTTDEWGVLGTFTVQNAAGWDAVTWALVIIPFLVGGVVSWLFWLKASRSWPVFDWKASGSGWQKTEGGPPTGDGKKFYMDHFTANSLTIPDPDEVSRRVANPQAIHPEIRVLYSVAKPRKFAKDRTTHIDVRGIIRQEYSFVPERLFPLAERYSIRSLVEQQKLPIGHAPIRGTGARTAADIAGPNVHISGYVTSKRKEVLNLLHDEVLDYLEDKQLKQRAKRESLKDAALAEEIRGAKATETYIAGRGSGIDGAPREPGTAPAAPTARPPVTEGEW